MASTPKKFPTIIRLTPSNVVQFVNNHLQPQIKKLKKEPAAETEAFEEVDLEYPCKHCHKTFCNKVALRNHMRIQHCDDNCDDIIPVLKEKGTDKRPLFSRNTEEIIEMGDMIEYQEEEEEEEEEDNDPHEMIKSTNVVPEIKPSTLINLASEDVSYIMVKIRDTQNDPKNRERKEKRKVDKEETPREIISLSGPFKCVYIVHQEGSEEYTQCGQIFHGCCDYSKHFYDEHAGKKRSIPRCQVCEKRLDQESEGHVCISCGQAFAEKYELDRHAATHIKNKPYECSVCMKRFSQVSSLGVHMRLHSNERPYKCSECPKAFTQKSGLQQHMRTHTNQRPFACIVCNKRFTQSIHLTQHMRTHTNIQPYECQVCLKRFKQPSHLNFHLKAHANDFSKLTEDEREKLADVMSKEANFATSENIEVEYILN